MMHRSGSTSRQIRKFLNQIKTCFFTSKIFCDEANKAIKNGTIAVSVSDYHADHDETHNICFDLLPVAGLRRF
jgi:hypothetical protein